MHLKSQVAIGDMLWLLAISEVCARVIYHLRAWLLVKPYCASAEGSRGRIGI